MARWAVWFCAAFAVASCFPPAGTTENAGHHAGAVPEESAVARWRRERFKAGREDAVCENDNENAQNDEAVRLMQQTWVRELGPAVSWEEALMGRKQDIENFRVGMEQTIGDLREQQGGVANQGRGTVAVLDLDFLPMPGSHGFTARKLASGFELHGYSATTVQTHEELQLIPDDAETIFLLTDHFLSIFRAPFRPLPNAPRSSPGGDSRIGTKTLWVAGRPQVSRETRELLALLATRWSKSFFLLWHWPEFLSIPFRRFVTTGRPAFADPPPQLPNYVPHVFAAAVAPEAVAAADVDFEDRYLDAHFVGNYYKNKWTEDLTRAFIYHTGVQPSSAVPEQERVEAMRHSKVVLGFHADYNVEHGVVTERVYEGMAYGCVVITDNPWAVNATDGIAVLVESKEEFLAQLQAFATNRSKTEERKRRGLQFARSKGTYFHLAARFLEQMHSIMHAETRTDAVD